MTRTPPVEEIVRSGAGIPALADVIDRYRVLQEDRGRKTELDGSYWGSQELLDEIKRYELFFIGMY